MFWFFFQEGIKACSKNPKIASSDPKIAPWKLHRHLMSFKEPFTTRVGGGGKGKIFLKQDAEAKKGGAKITEKTKQK